VDWAPTWSPDGNQIMWSRSSTLDMFADMFVMQADGSGQIRLTTTPKVDEYQPDWTA
jgi:Tol biopolymer transport system component